MKQSLQKIAFLALFGFALASTSVHAQHAIGARQFKLDDGSNHTLTLQSPPLTGNATFTFYPGAGAGTPAGTSTGQTLYWDNALSQWVANTVLTNNGSAVQVNSKFGVGIPPQVSVDVNGGLSLRPTAGASVAGGVTVDLINGPPGGTANNSSFWNVTFTGPGSFVGGFGTGIPGQVIILHNDGTNDCTIANEDGTWPATDRIQTMTGANITITGQGAAMFIYDPNTLVGGVQSSRWILVSVQQ